MKFFPFFEVDRVTAIIEIYKKNRLTKGSYTYKRSLA